jgi:hypothetical protein
MVKTRILSKAAIDITKSSNFLGYKMMANMIERATKAGSTMKVKKTKKALRRSD